MWHYLTLFLFLVIANSFRGIAQHVTIINHFQGDTIGRGLDGFRLSGTEQHQIVINYYEPADKNEIDRLSQLIGSSLNFYLDQSVEVADGKIKLRKSKKEILREMNEIVRSAVKYYDFKERQHFDGFSKQIEDKIANLEKLDFNQSSYATQVTDAESNKKLHYYFIQKELNDLKLLANLEVGNYGNRSLLVYAGSENSLVDSVTRDSLLKQLSFNPDSTLEPIQINYSDATQQLLSVTDGSSLPILSRSDHALDSFNAQIINMLEQNNQKLDRMQTQIDDLRAEQLRQFQAQQNKTNEQVQNQLSELRSMVVELVRMNSGSAMANSGREIFMGSSGDKGMVSNVPDQIDIYFQKGAILLDAESRLVLNEVVDILARNPALNLVITGYADKSGSAVSNLLLSQQRANAVKKFMTTSGLEVSRFVTRYLGDSVSEQENAADRRVALEFVTR